MQGCTNHIPAILVQVNMGAEHLKGDLAFPEIYKEQG